MKKLDLDAPSANGRNGHGHDDDALARRGLNGHALNSNGRDTNGRFAKGNAGGPGNPHAAQVARLRAAMLAAVTEEDMHAIVRRLVQVAKDGNVRAIKEVFDRTLGKPLEADLLDRIEALEGMLGKVQGR